MSDSKHRDSGSRQKNRLQAPKIRYDLSSPNQEVIIPNKNGEAQLSHDESNPLQHKVDRTGEPPEHSKTNQQSSVGKCTDSAISPSKLEDARFLVASMMGTELENFNYNHGKFLRNESISTRSSYYTQPTASAAAAPIDPGDEVPPQTNDRAPHGGEHVPLSYVQKPAPAALQSTVSYIGDNINPGYPESNELDNTIFYPYQQRRGSDYNQPTYNPVSRSHVPSAIDLDQMVERLHKVQLKIDIELHIKRGVEKIRAVTTKTTNPSIFKKRIEEVDNKIREIDEKIKFLRRAYNYHEAEIEAKSKMQIELAKPKILPVSTTESNSAKPDSYASARPVSRNKKSLFTGELRIQILKIQGFGIDPASEAEIYAVIKADDIQCAALKLSKGSKSEAPSIKLERANEVEIAFHTKKNVLCGLAWFRLHSIEMKINAANSELFDRVYRTRHDRDDATSRTSAGTSSEKEKKLSTEAPSLNNMDGDSIHIAQGKIDTPKSVRVHDSLSDLKPSPYHPPSTSKPNQGSHICDIYRSIDTLEGWLPVEPEGNAFIRVQAHRLEAKERIEVPKMLRRQKQVRKVVLHIGHNFVPTPSYHVRKCTICKEFLIGNIGYECVACKLCCHKKCKDEIFSACVSRLNSPSYGANGELRKTEELYSWHRIRHRFERYFVLSANWCGHCGCMMAIGRKASLKCPTCSIIIHTSCEPMVSNLCGLSAQFIRDAQIAMTASHKKSGVQLKSKSTDAVPALDLHPPATGEQLLGKTPSIMSATAQVSSQEHVAQEEPKIITSDSIVGPTPEHKLKQKSEEHFQVTAKKRASEKEPTSISTTTKLSDFVFISVIGRGNFGKVVLAGDIYTRDLYAIKILQKEFIIENDEVDSISAEKNVFITVNKRRHPFLTNLHSCFQTESYIYFVMEFVPGGDLMWHIQHQRFSPEMSKFYAVEVLLALEFLHENRIIYRDLKLDNILLTLNGHIKLADYGLCKSGMSEKVTTTTFCGTPEFMAPEVLLDKPYTRAVDYWAYGVLLYEMFFGLSPFQGDSEDEIFKEIIEKEIDYTPEIDPTAESLLRKLLVRSPNRRLGSGPKGVKEIKRHPYFKDVVWGDYYELKVEPLFKPKQSSRTDVTNFDTEFTTESPVPDKPKRKLTPAEQAVFKGFTYISDWADERRSSMMMKVKRRDTIKRNVIDAMIKDGTF